MSRSPSLPSRWIRLALHDLEARDVPAAAVLSATGGVLTVDMSLLANDKDNHQAIITGVNGTVYFNNRPAVGADGRPLNLRATDVKRIVVTGSALSDTINLSGVRPDIGFKDLNNNIVINGGGSRDTIGGSQFDDCIDAGGGDDRVFGNAGSDLIKGGDGPDDLYGDGNSDLATRDGGNDTLLGGIGDDTLNAGGGSANELVGGRGKDTFRGGPGRNDTAYLDGEKEPAKGWSSVGIDFHKRGTLNVHRLALTPGTGFSDHLAVNGTDGFDTINVRDAADPAGYEIVLNGQVEDTGLWADLRTLTVAAGDGNDSVAVQSTAYARYGVALRVEGGAGNDVIDAGPGNDTLVGGAGDDTLYGRAGNDRIEADAGADHAHGMEGNDIIWGAEDNDELTGGPGNDTLYGQTGNDVIWSGAGDDFAAGGEGDDGLSGDDGDDTLLGEAGNDQLSGSAGADDLYGGAGADAMWGGAGDDELYVERGVDGYDPGDGTDLVYANAVPAGPAVLRLEASGKMLDVDSGAAGQNGAKVQVWDNLFGANQQWSLEPVGGGFYAIRNLASGKVLDASAPDVNTNGCRVQQWDYLGWANQQWAVEVGGDGRAVIRNRASGKVLDARADRAGQNGGELQLWDDLGGVNQRWRLGEVA